MEARRTSTAAAVEAAPLRPTTRPAAVAAAGCPRCLEVGAEAVEGLRGRQVVAVEEGQLEACQASAASEVGEADPCLVVVALAVLVAVEAALLRLTTRPAAVAAAGCPRCLEVGAEAVEGLRGRQVVAVE